MEKERCEQCDFENPIKKGRACYVCKDCDRDVTVELVLMQEALK